MTTIETDEPGASDAATISRFSASGHDRLRGRPVAVVPITDFVDTSRPHNPNDRIRLGEMKRFGKAALGGGRRCRDVSEDIAIEVLERAAAADEDLPEATVAFIGRYTGLEKKPPAPSVSRSERDEDEAVGRRRA